MKVGQRVTPSGILITPADIPEEQWHALRRTGLGGSDVAALLGLNRYTSARELYLEKRDELPELPRPDALERAAEWGHLHEPLMATRFTRKTGLRTRRIGMIRSADRPWMLANLDRQNLRCPLGPCGLEIKNRSAWKEAEWGPSGDPDGVPDIEALQTHHYMLVTGYRHFHVGVLINGNDDRFYVVRWDPQIGEDLAAMEEAFWKRVETGDAPPLEGSDAEAELLCALWAGTEGREIALAPGEVTDLLERRKRLKGEIKATEGALTHVDNQLREMLGDAEVAAWEGRPLFTWKRNGAFSEKRFREAHPDLAAKYTRLAKVIDTAALAEAEPETYRAFRARVLRVATGGAA
jgi:putative phage-type endonuclease